LCQQTPVVTDKSTTEGKDWLISNMEDTFNEKEYFLVPSALIDASITSLELSSPFGGAMTYVPPTLVLKYQLLVQYKNISNHNVASVQIAGRNVRIPCHESVFLPAFVTSSVHNIDEPNVAAFICSPLSLDDKELAIVTLGFQILIHEDTDETSCTPKSNMRHLAQQVRKLLTLPGHRRMRGFTGLIFHSF
jgi:hypothetical protein